MKTHLSLRSTLSNVSWFQRGAAALLMAALMVALTLPWRTTTYPPVAAPAPTPAVRQQGHGRAQPERAGDRRPARPMMADRM